MVPLSEEALAHKDKPDDEEGRSNEEVRQKHVDFWSWPADFKTSWLLNFSLKIWRDTAFRFDAIPTKKVL